MTEYYCYKILYNWYEGEHRHDYVISSLGREQFEELLATLMNNINSYPTGNSSVFSLAEKQFSARCIPSAYDLLIKDLEENNCTIITGFDSDIVYSLDDDPVNNDNFVIEKIETEQIRKVLKTTNNK